MEINGKKVNWSDAVNLLVVGVLSWVAWTLIELDQRVTSIETKVELIDARGTSYVQSEVMTKLTEIHTDVKHLKEKND